MHDEDMLPFCAADSYLVCTAASNGEKPFARRYKEYVMSHVPPPPSDPMYSSPPEPPAQPGQPAAMPPGTSGMPGYAPQGMYPPQYAAAPRLPEPTNKTAVFVLGLLSVLMCFIGIVLGPIAIAMASKGRKEVGAGRAQPDGLLTAGWIMGIIGTCLGALYLILFVLWMIFVTAVFSFIGKEHHRWDKYHERTETQTRTERSY